MLNSGELHELAQRFNLPKRLLSEAQEVLLFNGVKPSNLRNELLSLCQSATEQGGSIEMFHRLLLGQVALLKASRTMVE